MSGKNNKKNNKEAKYAKKMGWQRLGIMSIEIEKKLTNDEKIDLGKEQSTDLMNIRRLEQEKKDFDGHISARIKQFEAEAHEKAVTLTRGHQLVFPSLPCFIDAKAKERVYMDLEKEEEVKREPMHDEDKQLNLDTQ